MRAKAQSSLPRINGKDSITIRRREFVGSVTNGTAVNFALTPASLSIPGYDINPSMPALFPWLSNIAVNYERYRFTSLKFSFIPSQSTTTAGRFYAAVDYDFDDDPATSKIQLMGNLTAVEVPLWQECSLVCDPKSLNRDLPYRFVSSTSRTLSVESRTSFAGFLMCGFDTQVHNCIMDLWVEYQIELVTPVYDHPLSETWQVPVAATTDVCTALGTAFFGLQRTPTVRPSGSVKIADSATPGFPSLVKTLGGASTTYPFALDLLGALGKGFLELRNIISVTGETPATLMGAVKTTVLDADIYSNLGVWITTLSALVVTRPQILTVTQGFFPSAAAVASALMYTDASVALTPLLDLYPTARYVVPFITSAVALGAGQTGWGYDFHK